MIPWEESQLHQEANYRLLRWAALVISVGSIVLAWLTDDWSFSRGWFLFLAVLVAALAVYAGIIWSVARLSVFVVRVFRRLFHREH